MILLDKLASAFGYTRVGNRSTWFPVTTGNSWAFGRITPEQALRVAAVMACVRIISRAMATLPLHVYESLPGGGKVKDRQHYLYRLLHTQPNSWQTSSEFRMMMQAHLCLRGNAYAEIISTAAGYPGALHPIHPDIVTVERNESTGKLQYKLRDPVTVKETTIQQEDMLHIRNLSLDGVVGLSPIAYAAETLGVSLATDRFGASFYRNGASVGNILESEKPLSEPAVKRLQKGLQKFTGSSNAGKTLILEEQMKWKRMGLAPNEAQFLETRKFNVADCCRIFGVPPHKVADLEKATFSNIEEQGIEFIQDCIMPWCVNWEQSIQRDLFESDDQHYAKFLLDGLWRGKLEDRTKALAMQLQNGALNQDEWREIEDRNPIPDGHGQKFFTPLNLQKGGPGGDSDVMGAWLGDIAERIATYETRELTKAKDFESFLGNRANYMAKILQPWLDHMGQSSAFAAKLCHSTALGLVAETIPNTAGRIETIKQTLLQQVQNG